MKLLFILSILSAFLMCCSSFAMTEEERIQYCNDRLYTRLFVQPYVRSVLKHVNHTPPRRPFHYERNPNSYSFGVNRFEVDFTETRHDWHKSDREDLKTFWDGVVSHYLERGLITADEIESRVLADSDYFHHNSEYVLFQEMVPGSRFPEEYSLGGTNHITHNPLAGGRITLHRKLFEPKNDIPRDHTYIRVIDLFFGQGDEAFKTKVLSAMKKKKARLINTVLISRVFMDKTLSGLEKINAYTELIDTAISSLPDDELFDSVVLVFAHSSEHAGLWKSWGFEEAATSEKGVIALISSAESLLKNLMKRTKLEADRVTRQLLQKFEQRPKLLTLPDWFDERALVAKRTNDYSFMILVKKKNDQWKLECSLALGRGSGEPEAIPCTPTFSIIPPNEEDPMSVRIHFDARFKKHRIRGYASFYTIDGSTVFESNYRNVRTVARFADGGSETNTQISSSHSHSIHGNHEKSYSTQYESLLNFEKDNIVFQQYQVLPVRRHVVRGDEGQFRFDQAEDDETNGFNPSFFKLPDQLPLHFIREQLADRGANFISPLWIHESYRSEYLDPPDWKEVFEILGIREIKPQK